MRWVVKMWSWVLFVRPSKRRLIASNDNPQIELLVADFLEEDEGW